MELPRKSVTPSDQGSYKAEGKGLSRAHFRMLFPRHGLERKLRYCNDLCTSGC